jgi:hypothetical protein
LLEGHGFKLVRVIPHWKRLPLEYVYRQLENFGPEYYRLASKLVPLLPLRFFRMKVPFYGGEMLLASEKR